MRKLILLLMLLCLNFGCQAEAEELKELEASLSSGVDSIQEIEVSSLDTIAVDTTEVSTDECDSMENDDISENEKFKYNHTINLENKLEINHEKVNEAISIGYESIIEELDIYTYVPNENDTISYLSQNSSFELGESLSHRGFEGLEVIYQRSQYVWEDFFGDLDATELTREITVKLKGMSIYETDIVDDYEKYYRFFDEKKGIYYEVTDLMMGNFTDPNSVLTKNVTGMSCNYLAIEGLVPPSYNPLHIEEEESKEYYITSLNDRPCLFIGSSKNDKWYQRWIDIEYGLVIKELVFDSEGLLIDRKIAISVEKKEITDESFYEPNDIEFKDISLYIFIADGGDVDTLKGAIYNHFPDKDFGLKLSSNDNHVITLYSTGISEMTPSIEDVVYSSQHTNDDGVTTRIREISDGRYYTIHDGLKIIEIYDKSCYEKKFFNFNDVGLLEVESTEKGMNYTFYDGNNISVSALYDVYEYIIELGVVVTINVYQVENIKDNIPIGDSRSYTYDFIEFDESVYDESCLDTYEIRDHGEGSFNDGEFRPFWYE